MQRRYVMKKTVLLSPEKKQYKANLHCHSTRSDGKLTPEELKRLYKENGYDILAITDHCSPKNHSALNDEDFLFLTGYEAYIRPDPNGRYNIFQSELHMNLFAREPDNETLICYNPHYTKYVPKEKHGELCRAGSEEPREYTVDYINNFIETAIENGYFVAYNHPVWSMESEERVLSYQNLFSLELYNTSSFVSNNLESGETLYDVMLRRGMRLGCHAGDDNHNKDAAVSDSCGWYTVFLSDALDYASIVRAMDEKNFYASNGPRIHEISVLDGDDGKTVHVECSPASKAFLHFGSKTPRFYRLPKGETAGSFDFPLHENAAYFRVAVYDEEGNVANSRGFFRDEWT